MEMKVRLVEEGEQKSAAEVESSLLEKHEESFNDAPKEVAPEEVAPEEVASDHHWKRLNCYLLLAID